MIEPQLIEFLKAKTGVVDVFFSHVDRLPESECIWFGLSGDDHADDLDADQEWPDVIFYDIEIYAQTPQRVQAIAQTLRKARGFRGLLVATDALSFVDDLAADSASTNYEPQANAESLPAHSAYFRLAVTGYRADQ